MLGGESDSAAYASQKVYQINRQDQKFRKLRHELVTPPIVAACWMKAVQTRTVSAVANIKTDFIEYLLRAWVQTTLKSLGTNYFKLHH